MYRTYNWGQLEFRSNSTGACILAILKHHIVCAMPFIWSYRDTVKVNGTLISLWAPNTLKCVSDMTWADMHVCICSSIPSSLTYWVSNKERLHNQLFLLYCGKIEAANTDYNNTKYILWELYLMKFAWNSALTSRYRYKLMSIWQDFLFQ